MSTNIAVSGGNIINIRKNPYNDNIVEYSLNNTNVWNTISFPCYITNTNTDNGFVKVYFTTEINITNTTQYFVCNSNKIQFGSDSLNPDGTIPTINVKINGYLGLIDNSNNNYYSNISIFNLFANGIDGTNIYTTGSSAGWIARRYFNGSNNYIINCSSNGNIGIYGGGIVGANSANSTNGSLYIIGCSTSGSIGNGAGGISGNGGGSGTNAVISINSCWCSGSISGTFAGGIVGQTSRCIITNCYSTGEISGTDAGGICGQYAVRCIITNCYSTGKISGLRAGGICNSNIANATITVSNCYTTGNNTGTNTGGILGYTTAVGTRVIQNCYVAGSGFTTGHIVYGYVGDNDTTTSVYNIEKCYSEAFRSGNGWNDLNASNANNVLTGTPSSSPGVGDTWVSTNLNTPYRILNIGYTPYSNQIINNNSLIRAYSSSVLQGQSSTTAVISYLSYQKLKITGGYSNSYDSINIDTNTGLISTLLSTSPGIYTIYVSNTGYNSSLYFTTYELTVNGTPKVIYMKNLFTDNSLVYYKSHSLSCGGVGTVKNYKAKCHKT